MSAIVIASADARRMYSTRDRIAIAAVAALVIVGRLPAARAQDYPLKPVRLISPFSAGGGADTVARFFAQRLSAALQQQIVVDPRPGAGSIIGTELAARAPPDGYTILIINDTHAINASLHRKLPYDPIRDFTPITLIASTPFMLVVHPSLPVKTTQDLVKLAKARPGQINYASSGNGTVAHFAGEYFKMTAGVDIVHIPYRGITGAVIDVAAGAAQMMIVSPLTVLSLVRSGKLRALAVTSTRRASALPELPTMQEGGLKRFEFSSAYGLLAPRHTPDTAIAVLNQGIARALKADEVQARLKDECAEPVGSTPDALQKYLIAQTATYAKLVHASGMKIE
ncbi:MAG TPA: tripartite tricarboxylate transporter substrate binding protein [Burkholderiales bacterium]|nr:tripartite tricarboxylate transporter substrate binding protein [Burkholderiales bacterium]